MEEYEYHLVCYFCEAKVILTGCDSEEKPRACPMCGTECETDWEE